MKSLNSRHQTGLIVNSQQTDTRSGCKGLVGTAKRVRQNVFLDCRGGDQAVEELVKVGVVVKV